MFYYCLQHLFFFSKLLSRSDCSNFCIDVLGLVFGVSKLCLEIVVTFGIVSFLKRVLCYSNLFLECLEIVCVAYV